MTALANPSSLKQVGSYLSQVQVPVKSGVKIYMGALVCLMLATGYAVPAGTAGTGPVVGVAQADAAIPGTDGAANVNLLTGVFTRPLHATHVPTIADVDKPVYASDDQTISNDPGDGPVAGVLVGFEASSGWAIVLIGPGVSSKGAGSTGYKEIPLYGILAAGTPMAAFADNAASAPGITLADSKVMGLRWNNNATQVPVWMRFALPEDIDVTADATIEVRASKTGATVGDATTFTIAAFLNPVGALHDFDADFGGATSAMVGNAAAKTVQKVTRTLATADLLAGAPGDTVSMSIKPTDGTLGTDDVIVDSIILKYRRK